MRKILTALLAAPLLASAIFAPSALAEPGGGAEVFKDEGCIKSPDFNVCFSFHFVNNFTETPSGNVNVISNGRFRASGAWMGETFNVSGREQFRLLLKDGEEQVVSERFRFKSRVGSVECRERFVFHLANGVVRQDRSSVKCQPG